MGSYRIVVLFRCNVGHVVARMLIRPCVSLLLRFRWGRGIKMNLEEEVFKIGKQLEKIVGEEGTVSHVCLCFDRSVL